MIRISIALTILTSALTVAAAEHEGSVSEIAESPASENDHAPVEQSQSKPGKSAATLAAASGALSPFSVAPGTPHAATALALSGYDSAAKGFRARGAAEGRILKFLTARVEFEHGPANGPSDRVSVGLRATLLNQATHGLDLGVLAFYQPRDFREEGNVVAGLSLARRFDRFTVILNPLAGSDPEGDDRSLELRLAGLYNASSWLVVGLDSRGRYNLSSDMKRAGHSIIDWEAQAGALASFGVGPLLFTTLVGPSFLQRTSFELDGGPGERQLSSGLLAMAGAGASF
ncbi:MAG: hypothetical protein ABUL60_20810 [Myxococcales bacterium]